MDYLQSIEIGQATALRIAVAPSLVNDAQRLANEFATTLTLSDDAHVRSQFTEFCRQRGKSDASAARIAAALDTESPHNNLAIFGDALQSAGGPQCLAELRYLTSVYRSLTCEFTEQLSQFLASEAQDIAVAHYYPHGLNVAAWLAAQDNSENTDNASYLASSPVAVPLAGLVQLVRVLVHCRLSGLPISDYVRQFRAVTGYGQGLVVAAAVASATSDEQYVAAAKRALGTLILAGCLPLHVAPEPTLHPSAVAEGQQHEGVPTTIIKVRGSPQYIVDAVLSKYNAQFRDQPSAKLHLSAINTDDEFIVSGHISEMYQFVRVVRSKSNPAGVDQSQVPFHARKPEVQVTFLPTAVVPLYCEHMSAVVDRHMSIAAAKGWNYSAAVDDEKNQLLVPLRACSDGKETTHSGADLARILVESVYTRRINWPLAIGRPDTTRIVDFSGADSHLSAITRQTIQGYGISLVSAVVSTSSTTDNGANWAQAFGPQLVRLASPSNDSKLHLDTPLSRVLGHPAVLVAGVQPTTANVHFVAAVAHAGYLAELAVSSVRTKDELCSLVTQLADLQPAGHGIALSCSLAGLTEWQAPVIANLRQREHLPIVGVCIDDAIPSVAQASQLICSLQAAGLGYFALKPTTVAQVQQTLDIAQANPSAAIVLQWTGGRTGGAHSFEEFHMPIMQVYKQIRQHSNVVLVANSGFGDADSALPYVTGTWGPDVGRAHMPFDGIMLGSRAMVAQEARTDDAVKQLIVAAKGMDAYNVERLFVDDNNNGGVESGCGVVSILGADGKPTHVLATRAALLCKNLSETVFSKPKDKQLPLLLARKDEIITRLNSDFMRPWFGRKADGSVADLQDMTYAEVINRLVELLYVKHEQRWVNNSYRQFAAKFVDRTNMRLLSSERPFTPSIVVEDTSMPLFDVVLDEAAYVLRAIPKASTLLVTSEDIQFFVNMSRLWMTERHCPLPFIACIDADFADYLLRDSWWQSENLATVVGQDAQRVLVRQGPVSVGYSTCANEPIKQILDSTYNGITESLAPASANVPIPVVEYVEYPSLVGTLATSLPNSVAVTCTESERTYQLPMEAGHAGELEMPSLDAWLSAIAGPNPSWLRALLTSAWIVQGPRRVRNYVRDVMRPRPGRRVIIELLTDANEGHNAQVPISVEIRNADGAKELEISAEECGVISLSIFHNNGHIQRALCFDYHYRPEQTSQAPIHELMGERETRVRDFYADMCLMTSEPRDVEESHQIAADAQLEFVTADVVVTKASVADYCRTTNTDLSAYPPNSEHALDVPMEYMSVLASRSIVQALVSPRVYSGLLTMCQTASHVELTPGAEPVQIGHAIGCTTRVIEVSTSAEEGATTVVLRSSLQRGGKPVAQVTSTFGYSGGAPAGLTEFRHVDEPLARLTIQSADDISVLEAKEWYLPIHASDSTTLVAKLQIGSILEFRLQSEYRLGGVGYTQAVTTGSVHLKTALYEYTHIANVDYADGTSCGNPVVEYLAQRASVIGEPAASLFDEDRSGRNRAYCLASGLMAWAPQSTQRSAAAMGNYNPRNTNEYVADLAQLGQQAIVADQWASATVRRFIEQHVANGNPHRLKSYSAQFLGPVLAGDQVEVQLTHVGMRSGRLVVEAVARSRTTGATLLEATCEVAPQRTAYMFTGQGSQEQGMGFDLYETSEAVRTTYDRADRHMRERFGFSILDIIRKNPREYTVRFGGLNGARIRRNYMEFQQRVYGESGEPGDYKYVPLFPEVTETAPSYTFRSPTGLLNATQFAQPSIMLFDVAVANDLRSRGLFDETSILTGHSLGEYGALAVYGVMTLEDIIDITFIRGMTMQSTVTRDAQYRSDFAMVAANPSRVHKTFDEGSLAATIDLIRNLNQGGGLLEVVNYNVRGYQYVVAGTRAQLALLGCVLDEMSRLGINPSGGNASCPVAQIIETFVARGGCGSEVKRTKSTIPVPGIDVPFHSSHLLPGADFFRSCINAMVRPTDDDCSLLFNRYIPNLTAVPFAVTPEYFQLMVDQTGSPVAALELSRWPADGMMTDVECARLGRVLVVELLSYQFASPVRWIEAQDRLLKEYKVERIIEVGPSATLCRMAEGSVKLAGLENQVTTLHVFRDEDEVSFRPALPESLPESVAYEGSGSVSQTATATVSRADSESGEKDSAPESVVAGSETTAVEASVAVPDVPLKSVFVIRTVVAQKLKRPLSEVSADRSVRDLTGGKSTLQNEILGDLLKEFNLSPSGPIPDRPDEISLLELSAGLSSNSGGSAVRALGKHTTAQVARLFSTKMPGGVTQSAVRRRLESEHGIGRAHQQDAVLLLALTMEPAARLGSEPDAHAWLGGVVQAYAQACGIVLGPTSNGAKSGGGVGKQAAAVVINSQEFDRAQAAQRALALQQVEAYAKYLGLDMRAGHRQAERAEAAGRQAQQQLDALADELGPEFVAGIQRKFDARKARVFDSCWNWAREDALQWISQVLAHTGEAEIETVDEPEARMLMLANRADALLVQLLRGLCATLGASTGSDHSVARAHALAQRMLAACTQALGQPPVVRISAQPTQPETSVGVAGSFAYREAPRAGEPTMAEYVAHMRAEPAAGSNAEHRPLLHLRHKTAAHAWEYAAGDSREYYACLAELTTGSSAFAGTTALVTGCSSGSIAAAVVEQLLAGGARVIATTSSYSKKTMRFYERMYKQHGSRGSELIAVPFNQGSAADVRSLVEYVFRTLAWDLDYVLPFAAVGDYGRDVSQLDGRAELSVRVMLTNVLRLVGEIRRTKRVMGLDARPTLAVLPLSPNHGVFGHDGLYGECKAALETAFNRWASEAWGDHVSVAGAVIGWTRGTGLMAANNAIAEALEAAEGVGARTFSTNEMALNIVALLHPRIAALALHAPVWADLNGGLQRIARVNDAVTQARQALVADVSRRKNVAASAGADIASALGHRVCILHMDHEFSPMFDYRQEYPKARSSEQLQHLRHLQGMANLDKVVVVTGYGEVSPLGSAETRWEMEAYGEFSLEGCIELAWIMGLIKHASSTEYTGWVDAEGGMPIRDVDVKARYEEHILAHTGIRLLESAMLENPEIDPSAVPIFRELLIEHDMPPFEASADEAAQFKLRNGDLVDTWANDDGSWSVRLRKGAVLMVPKALRFDRLVGAQLPTGWDPVRFGIPRDVVDQVDLVTCFALVAASEALIRSGITDPYELYRYFHVSEVGTAVGAGAGGVHAIRAMYHKRMMDKHVQSDVLQETFANTTAAWINMLLLSAAGPIKIPTGGCATSVLSFDIAADTIRSGKARVMLAGGFEGFVEEGSYEFAQMGATSNAVEEAACGREPSEMSRPCTTTRTGFVEAQGAGIVVLMSAAAAIEYGAPIYAILAHTATATDKQGSSLPAPGMGILTTARETGPANALLDISYRRRQIERGLRAVDAWEAEERATEPEHVDESLIAALAAAKRAQVLDAWGTEFWRTCPDRISPLRGALAAWGLTPDDIGLASFHGTGTMANDRNESFVLDAQLRKLGRTPGYAVPAVCQKHLTGHPKGPAAAWMLNGALQSLRTGIVPGNRNADNIDGALKHEFIVYPSQAIRTPLIKAALLKSFGFGQVGAEMLVVHPDYLLATLTDEQREDYNRRVAGREAQSYRSWQDTFVGNRSLVQVKSAPPYAPEQEERIYLDPLARASYDATTKSYHF